MPRKTPQGLVIYRQSIKELKRKAILKAAHEAFLAEGFNRAAVHVIAHRADSSTATLYKYFKSKERLFEEVICEAYGDEAASAATITDGAPADILFAFLKESVRRHSSQDANNLLRIAWAEVPDSVGIARDFFEHRIQEQHAGLRRLLEVLMEQDELVNHDVDLGAHQISGMVKEALVWPGIYQKTYELPDDADEIIRQAIETYLARFSARQRSLRC